MLNPTYTIDQDTVCLSAELPVRGQRLAPQKPCEAHDHEFYEIVVITGGEGTHLTAEGRENVRRGQAFIVSPRSVHGYPATRGLELINLYYLADWFLADIAALRRASNLVPLFFEPARQGRRPESRIVSLAPAAADFGRLESELLDLLRAQHAGASLLYRESCFFKVLDTIAHAASAQGWRNSARPVREEVDRALQTIETLVLRREGFDAQAVARNAGLSPGRLGKLMREQIGMSPLDYFQQHRIHHVCRRLLSSKLSIAEIAHEFHYADAAHLNRHFRRLQNLTPSEYRQRFGPR